MTAITLDSFDSFDSFDSLDSLDPIAATGVLDCAQDGNATPRKGNRCGHDPKAFRAWDLEPPRPKLIRVAQKAIMNIFSGLSPAPAGAEWIWHHRSERREAMALVYSALLDITDLYTLRAASPDRSGRGPGWGRSGRQLMQLTGLSRSRTWRALADLRAAGWITGPVCPDGFVRRFYDAAIRSIPASVFEAIGLGSWLEEERAKRAEDQEQYAALYQDQTPEQSESFSPAQEAEMKRISERSLYAELPPPPKPAIPAKPIPAESDTHTDTRAADLLSALHQLGEKMRAPFSKRTPTLTDEERNELWKQLQQPSHDDLAIAASRTNPSATPAPRPIPAARPTDAAPSTPSTPDTFRQLGPDATPQERLAELRKPRPDEARLPAQLTAPTTPEEPGLPRNVIDERIAALKAACRPRSHTRPLNNRR